MNILATTGPSTYWYLTRSTGAVALVLLTLAIALGVIDVERWSTPRWPRFVVDSLHRNVSLLAVAFLALHILTAVLDSFAPISLANAVIPFGGTYRPFWLGLGAVSFDLILAVTFTSLLRQRMGYSTWRTVHWLTYASWPVALLHSLGTGSDVKSGWMLWLGVGCMAVVVVAILVRALDGWPEQLRTRTAALAGTGIFSPVPALLASRGAAWHRMGQALGHASRAAPPPAPDECVDRGRTMSGSSSLMSESPSLMNGAERGGGPSARSHSALPAPTRRPLSHEAMSLMTISPSMAISPCNGDGATGPSI